MDDSASNSKSENHSENIDGKPEQLSNIESDHLEDKEHQTDETKPQSPETAQIPQAEQQTSVGKDEDNAEIDNGQKEEIGSKPA